MRGAPLALLALVALIALVACPRAPVGQREPPADGTRIVCPVTGEGCEKRPDTPSAVYESRTYYFCSPDAARRFGIDPARFADR